MENQEALIVLAAAKEEIRCLRRDNQLMAARLEVFDTFRAILHACPYPQQPMAVDIIWQIDNLIDNLTPKEATPPPADK